MIASSAQDGALLKLRLRGLLLPKFAGEVPSLYLGLKEPRGLREGNVKEVTTFGIGTVVVAVAVAVVLVLFSMDIGIAADARGTVEFGVCMSAIRFAAAAAAATSGWSFLRTRTA